MDYEDIIAMLTGQQLGAKRPDESEGAWEERRADAIARAKRIYDRVLEACRD